MPRLVVCGDTHFRIEEPFFSAQKEFVKWFLKQPFNNSENVFIHLGDVFNCSGPNPNTIDLAVYFNKEMKFKNKFYLVGSHDYNRSRNTYSPTPLRQENNTEIIYDVGLKDLEGIKCLFLPFIYDRAISNKTQKEFYEEFGKKENIKCDFCFHHLQDETICFGGISNGINLSWVQGERIGGHIHKRQKGYLGTPCINRFDEKGKDSFLLLIDTETKEKEYIKTPQFLDYKSLDYEKNNVLEGLIHLAGPGIPIELKIFDIINAPSKEAAEEKYKGRFIHEIFLKKNEEEQLLQEEQKETKTIKEYFNNFCIKNKISKKLQEKLGVYL